MTKSSPPFTGLITALVTPFKKGKIDYPSVKRLVKHQLDNGVQGFVVNGTTGESPTLHSDEVEKLFRFIKKITDDSVPLIIGTGTNSTEETIAKTKKAQKLGADAALVVVPYYNKPPQRALVTHYTAVAKSTKLPIILYNVPGRTVVSMSAETILQLSKTKNIVGVKEASGQIAMIQSLEAKADRKFLLSSGDDTTAIEFILAGGHGVISVISHVIPNEMRAAVDRARRAEAKVREDYKKFAGLNRLLSLEANPIPVKMMLYLMGVIDSPELRLPLLALEGENKKIVMREIENLRVSK
jgi:4-hydroxy-tetrahydrodipicolinate synthase